MSLAKKNVSVWRTDAAGWPGFIIFVVILRLGMADTIDSKLRPSWLDVPWPVIWMDGKNA